MPPMDQPTPPQQVNDVWGTAALDQTSFITLPSGQTCHAKPVGLQAIMEAGLIGEADSLSAYVGKQHIRRVRGANGQPDGESVDAKSLMRDPESLKKIVKLVDQATPMIVEDPAVWCHFIVKPGGDTAMLTPEQRVCSICNLEKQHHVPGGTHEFKSRIYTDMIGIEDKMFLFQFGMGGLRQAEAFREGSDAAVGDLADGQGVSSYAVPTGGGGKRKRPKRRTGNGGLRS